MMHQTNKMTLYTIVKLYNILLKNIIKMDIIHLYLPSVLLLYLSSTSA